jgi:hypothetical protein
MAPTIFRYPERWRAIPPFPDDIIDYTAFTAIYRRFQLKISTLSPRDERDAGGGPFGSFWPDLTASRAPGTNAESTKAGGLARDKVRNARWKVRRRILSSCPQNPSATSATKHSPESIAINSRTAKITPDPACCSKLQFRQRMARQGVRFEIDTCKPPSLEVARRAHHARWRRKSDGVLLPSWKSTASSRLLPGVSIR